MGTSAETKQTSRRRLHRTAESTATHPVRMERETHAAVARRRAPGVREPRRRVRDGRRSAPMLSSVLDAFERGELGKRDLRRLATEYDFGVSAERLVELGLRRRMEWLLGAVTGRE